jgi:hypothetical protein
MSRVSTPLLATLALISAATVGVLHGISSLYWAAGGDWLLATLGDRLVAAFTERRWLLIPIGILKIGFAVLPLALTACRRAHLRIWRALCWAGAAVLVAWGGANTVVGNLVLGGVIRPAGGYDHDAMVGHAWLWDPLFLIWGLTLAFGLAGTGPRREAGSRGE